MINKHMWTACSTLHCTTIRGKCSGISTHLGTLLHSATLYCSLGGWSLFHCRPPSASTSTSCIAASRSRQLLLTSPSRVEIFTTCRPHSVNVFTSILIAMITTTIRPCIGFTTIAEGICRALTLYFLAFRKGRWDCIPNIYFRFVSKFFLYAIEGFCFRIGWGF
mgnify:CR=1 FL=1